jgi:hypothetical protein
MCCGRSCCGNGGILEAFSMPLGSASTLFNPPEFAGPSGIPLIGEVPAPASPAIIANDAVGAARRTKHARATVAGMLDMKMLHYLARAWMFKANLGLSIRRRH